MALCIALGVLASVGVRLAWSQVTTATFYGIVQDASGAVVPGVDVTLTHEGTSTQTVKTTDENGEFTFDFLRIGSYSLRIEAPGFKAFSSAGIELAAAQPGPRNRASATTTTTPSARTDSGTSDFGKTRRKT